MAMTQVQDGLEGVLAFATEIAEPDRDGGALRYRGVEIGELVERAHYEQVWGLLVDDDPDAPLDDLAGSEGFDPVPKLHSGDFRVDLQAGIAMLGAAWGLPPLVDIRPDQVRDQLQRVSAAALRIAARSARGADAAHVDAATVAEGRTVAERFLLRWRGALDTRQAEAIDAYWITAAEHGMNASTFTARVIASTGTDVAAALSGAVGALSGPLHGGAPARVLQMLEEVEATDDPRRYVETKLARGERIMGFGHRVYRAEDPRARALRATARRLGSPRLEAAEALEVAALEALAAHKPDRVLATNVEFWSAVILDHAQVPQSLFTTLFACARLAGWSAHVLEQRETGRLIRPASLYVGRGPRALAAR